MIQEQVNLFPYPETATDRQNIQSAIRFYSAKCWSLPAPLQDRYFSRYYLIYWSGEYLHQQLQDASGYIVRKDCLTSPAIQYRVEFFRNMNRGKILARPQDQFALSFRMPAAEWNLPAIVLISGANGANHV